MVIPRATRTAAQENRTFMRRTYECPAPPATTGVVTVVEGLPEKDG
jgi:hypothetical protein